MQPKKPLPQKGRGLGAASQGSPWRPNDTVGENSRGSQFQDKRVESWQGPNLCSDAVELAAESHMLQEGSTEPTAPVCARTGKEAEQEISSKDVHIGTGIQEQEESSPGRQRGAASVQTAVACDGQEQHARNSHSGKG